MRKLVPLVIRPWALPLIVVALVAPIVGGFYLGGPPLGLAIGALAVAALLVIAARAQFDEPIEVPASPDTRYRLLIVVGEPLDSPAAVERIVAIAMAGRDALGSDQPPEARVLAPAHLGTLDRWASDLGQAREEAAKVLAVSLASLAAAGIDATSQIGDPDPVQAIRDELAGYPAREVLLIAGEMLGAEEAEEVGRRLDRPVRLLDPSARPG